MANKREHPDYDLIMSIVKTRIEKLVKEREANDNKKTD